MNTQLFVGSATAVALAIAGFAAPANAVSFSFGTNGIRFSEDTKVTFQFKESHGAYQSALKVFEARNLNQAVANLFYEVKPSDKAGREFLGTFGNAVTSGTGKNSVDFLFKKDLEYTLGLVTGAEFVQGLSGGKNQVVYSTNRLNTASQGSQQAVFGDENSLWSALDKEATRPFQLSANFSSANPFASPVLVSFDDRGNANDTDFQDFAVVTRAEAVPEPLTLLGTVLAGAGVAYARRQRKPAEQ